MTFRKYIALAVAASLAACGNAPPETAVAASGGEEEGAMQLTSPTISEGQVIPAEHTCDGADRSPALSWSGVPEGTQAFALVCEDPDAPSGDWIHWVAYDIPAQVTEVTEGVAPEGALPGGGSQGVNDWDAPGWRGPCPPRGTHRYVFTLYALSEPTGLPAGATAGGLRGAIATTTLGTATLTAPYQRQ